jgi:hypothetical protein
MSDGMTRPQFHSLFFSLRPRCACSVPWLLREDHWRTDRFDSIKVISADEPQEKSPPPLTLRLPCLIPDPQ